jgi:hypothetical protein
LQGSKLEPLMSALGQKQRSAHVRGMSALPLKADIIADHGCNVRFVPKAEVARSYSIALSTRATTAGGVNAPVAE